MGTTSARRALAGHTACRSLSDLVSLVLTLPVSPVLLATPVLVVAVRGPVVPVFPALPLVAHLAGLPRSVKQVRSKNRPVPCGLCRNSWSSSPPRIPATTLAG